MLTSLKMHKSHRVERLVWRQVSHQAQNWVRVPVEYKVWEHLTFAVGPVRVQIFKEIDNSLRGTHGPN